MSTTLDPQAHEAPLKWLASHLHANAPLAERVRALRKKRRKAKATPVVEVAP